MAHATIVGGLAAGLVASITGISSDDSRFKTLKDRAFKGLKESSHGRTNPFEINERYSGLVEKFGVLNHDDLAEALQSRLQSLSKAKLTPEILSLLLQLSDRPLENTHIEDLSRLARPSTPPAKLTWDEILADDPLTDDEIWDGVERGYHSSGDEAVDDEQGSDLTTSTQATSLGEDDFASLAGLHIVKPDCNPLHGVQSARRNLEMSSAKNGAKELSELTLIRETLNMLHGLPTYIYHLRSAGTIAINDPLAVATTSHSITVHLLGQFAEIGTCLNSLRLWGRAEQEKAYIHAIQAAIQQTLTLLDSQIGDVEQRFVQPQQGFVVSLVEVHAEIEALARPVVRLSEIVILNDQHDSSPFALLDTLYSETCLAHMTGDVPLFAAIVHPMLSGLRAYMRPVLSWASYGTLTSREGEHFFVHLQDENCALGDVWHKRFALRLLSDGSVCAPSMLQPFIQRAYAMGKSKAFANLLDLRSEDRVDNCDFWSTGSDLITVSECLETSTLTPFEELLRKSLNDCIEKVSSSAALPLKTTMLNSGGLIRILQALNYVSFAKDGMLLQAFTDALFDRMRRHPKTWKDRFLLTRLVQSTLGTAPGVDAHCIGIVVPDENAVHTGLQMLQQLDQIKLTHAISWPVQNVIRSSDLPTYSAAFSLLIQVEYATQTLRLLTFDIRKLKAGCRDLPRATQLALSLRARLLWFVNILRAHIASTAAEHVHGLQRSLEAADGIDSMAEIWDSHNKRLGTDLLLGQGLKPVREAVTSMLQLCESLADTWPLVLEQRGYSGAAETMALEFDRDMSFLSGGLQTLGRAGTDHALANLAEQLRWDAE